MASFNALDVVTYQMDQELGSDLYRRFRDYLEHVQQANLLVDEAMSDPKGNRGLSPSE
jgi:4-hydroxybutyryl-CoA dehydratase/vinylacetyl-CoA-Delta-isomerase